MDCTLRMQHSSKEAEFKYLNNETAEFIALLLSRLQAELHFGRTVSKCVGLLFECPRLPTCPTHMSSFSHLCSPHNWPVIVGSRGIYYKLMLGVDCDEQSQTSHQP